MHSFVSELFKKHEIDTSTFRTLTENDLKEIGISMVGPRRKIMICIAGKQLKLFFRILTFN